MKPKWQFAWRFSFRSSGLLLALIAGALIFARILIALANVEQAEATFGSFEIVIPLIVGLHAALLFAPDDEPALELLLAAPRPTVYLLYERLAALIGLQGGLALILSLLAVIVTPGSNLLDLVIVWLPPSVCIVGLCLVATLYARRTAFGVLMAIGICVAMAFGREVVLPMFPNLWFMMFYLDPRTVSADQYLLNRLFLIVIGIAAVGLTLWRMRDEEQLLGFQEVKNG